MSLNAIPNPTREVTINESVTKIMDAISKVASSFPDEYRLEDIDYLLNTARVHITDTDVISKLTLDMGQNLDISLHRTNDNETRVVLLLSRTVGTINQSWESTRATNTMNTFLKLLSQALQGKLEQSIQAAKETSDVIAEKNRKNAWIAWTVAGLIVLFFIYKIIEARSLH